MIFPHEYNDFLNHQSHNFESADDKIIDAWRNFNNYHIIQFDERLIF